MAMNDIKKLIRNIDRGADLKRNLPVYGKLLCDTYLNYAAVELTFSAYLLSETVSEYTMISEEEHSLYREVTALLKAALAEEDGSLQKTISEGKKIRERITNIMEIFTSYTDRLICYEYVLERMKLKFTTDEEVLSEIKTVNEDDFMTRLMMFLVGNEDQSVIRDRVQTVMGRIPVHMTKSKFLDRVNETLSLYKGGDAAALDGFVYMIRSAAMLQRPDDSILSDQEIHDLLEQLDETEFSELDEKSFQELSSHLERVGETIFHITDFYYSLQKVVNGILALCLVKLHNPERNDVFETCQEILRSVTAEELAEEELVKLEGKIEEYVEKTSYLEAVLFETKTSCRETLEELGLMEAFEDYALIANLLSDSLFIDIDQTGESGIAEDEKVRQVSAELTEELSSLLGTLKRPVKKAVMAAVLEKLPVDFSDSQEIEAYIRTNLFGCQDFAERGAVLLELEELMDEEVEWRER